MIDPAVLKQSMDTRKDTKVVTYYLLLSFFLVVGSTLSDSFMKLTPHYASLLSLDDPDSTYS